MVKFISNEAHSLIVPTREYSGINDRQSYVSKSGTSWEQQVMDFTNDYFARKDVPLLVLRGKGLKKQNPLLWSALGIPVNNGKKIEGDIDLIVVNKARPNVPLAVISCKTSLHGRFSETLFYAVIWKQNIPKFVVVFATPDKGRQAKEGQFGSEWGTEENPTKDRQLAEKYLDGVYIQNEKTSFGGKVKRIEELPNDLRKLLLA
jgi:hypothetical protein